MSVATADKPDHETTQVDQTSAMPSLDQPLTKKPGRLFGDVTLTLHTFQASELLLGRPHSETARAIMGINHFNTYMGQIIAAAASGDIYAAAALIGMDEKLIAAESQLDTELVILQKQIAANSRLSVDCALSNDPVHHVLQLSSPYAHWAARLVGRYDELVAAALSAQRASIIKRPEYKQVRDRSRTAIRSAFHVARNFKFTGITRDDYEQKTARALEAIETFGPVPADILGGTRKPSYQL